MFQPTNRVYLGIITVLLFFALVIHARSETGISSIYGNKDGFEYKQMANGQKMIPTEMIAAHKTLPLGSVVKVTNLENQQTATVIIKDRGPYIAGRIIDISPAVAKVLKFSGLAKVALEVLHYGDNKYHKAREGNHVKRAKSIHRRAYRSRSTHCRSCGRGFRRASLIYPMAGWSDNRSYRHR